eukprot:CAMPEP_0183724566 /NCGR_PEP_ID=MMETSP0737-20130205/18009_1 /TAXON_ID=385413 /ORGANISM="Thalassiosira miniscula, Strain CCMP1093" /LENGTH=493 /DNA_ID=CAMNT_0025955181 /DNA_START=20 /DNA_END=1501 /DNA_ORIENTATION=+
MKLSATAVLLALGLTGGAAFVPASLSSRSTTTSLNVATGKKPWTPDSWTQDDYVAKQMPVYESQEEVDDAIGKLNKKAPLVFAGEVRRLTEQLARVSQGQGFVLMGGDCAESFKEFNVNHIRDTFRVMMQMALVMTFGGSMPVVKIGRMAGQFAKPRSAPEETIDGVTLPSYRGDNVNREEFTAEARRNDPSLMVAAYDQSAQTLNILRAFSTGGFADMSRLQAWNLDFVEGTDEGSRYRKLAEKVDESLRFMKAIGIDTSSPDFSSVDFYTGHECLLLPYEQALTREDSITGKYYGLSTHLLWVGERTRDLDSAHLEFVRGVDNPLGVKISDKCTQDELIQTIETMNPQNIPGKLSIIVRMGAEKLRENLPGLIRAVQREGKSVVWISDPVHGNTRSTADGFKTRDFDAIRAELRAFFDVHDEMGSHPGGMHLEMTGDAVTECTGGVAGVTDETLKENYVTACDPRLNGIQALELAFLVAERMRARTGLPPL